MKLSPALPAARLRAGRRRGRWRLAGVLGACGLLAAPAPAQEAARSAGAFDECAVLYITDRPVGRACEVVVPQAAASRGEPAPAMAAAPPAVASVAQFVREAARLHRVDAALIHAVIGVESGYAARAVSSRGARGLMQVLPGTARQYGAADLFDPQQNILVGTRHLRALLDRFNDDKSLALAAYNAGEGAVLRHGLQVPPFAETRAYVPAVLARYESLRKAQRDTGAAPW
ncbi:lytic transglycosylase domain-containing protein [Methylibium sp.]|uniref:lytic transglycosylase domain-containing protein n=1 Tax=Methylibium sp. TaxID=2067992 RepID=UPI003D0C5FCC